MRLAFIYGMLALALCLLLAPTMLDGLFAWCVLLAVAGAVWVLSPDDCERNPK